MGEGEGLALFVIKGQLNGISCLVFSERRPTTGMAPDSGVPTALAGVHIGFKRTPYRASLVEPNLHMNLDLPGGQGLQVHVIIIGR